MWLIHHVLDWYETWKTSEGSIPSIGLGRERLWTPYSFLLHFSLLSTRPDGYPMLDSEVVRYRDNSDTYARAWLDGYTVEKNKRYFVRLKGVVDNLRLLRHNSPTNTWTIGSEEQCFNVSRAHTHKELEEAGFGEVFNSPLFEVEEVEE